MYQLKYSVDGVKAVSMKENPKELRQLITELDKSRKVIDWYLYNDGGVLLDSAKEQKVKTN